MADPKRETSSYSYVEPSDADLVRNSASKTVSQMSRKSRTSHGEVSILQEEESLPSSQSRRPTLNLEALMESGQEVEHAQEEKEDEKESEETVYEYQPPMPNYIQIEFGDSAPILMNPTCIKKNFVDHINRKMGTSVSMEQFDLSDTHGHLVGLRHLDSHEDAGDLFTAPQIYIPCKVFVGEEEEITAVEPCLNHWLFKYPALAKLDPNYKKNKVGETPSKIESDSAVIKKKSGEKKAKK